MARWTVSRTINAPIETVFSAISDVDHFAEVRPQVVKIDYLSEIHSGVGTRFRETRRMKGKDTTNDLEITEYEPGRRIRFVTASHGTTWDSIYIVKPQAPGTVLALTMEATSETWLPKIMVLLISGVLQTALEGDMDTVKAFCERPR